MPLPVVPPTFQVTAWEDPPAQLTAVFGAVTENGDEVSTLLTMRDASFAPPPLARLSRPMTEKVSERIVCGSVSPNVVVLLSSAVVFGTVRTGLVEGLKLRMIGPEPGSVPTVTRPPPSRCSQS